MHMLKYHGAGTLIYYISPKDEAYILLGKRLHNPGKNLWSIPGGGWDEHDGFINDRPDYKETARRELMEETSFLLYKKSKYFLKRIWSIHTLFFNFEVFALRAKRIQTPSRRSSCCEFSEMKWFNINKIPETKDCNEFLTTQINNLKIFLKEKGHASII